MTSSLNIIPIESWLSSEKQPLIIAGPCSAETELQVMETAIALANIPYVKVFRAGIWKPRTRPKLFEGVGNIGLQWLKRVKAETGLLTTVEVATPEHVEECLKNNIDILWIGARTAVNPFSVQEIADSLKGVDIPIIIKNPVNPDVQLWLGVIERFYQAGINKIIAVHRGFYDFEKSPYRNAPIWEIPIELKRLCPEIPIFCDPSHIAGRTSLLADISQKALDLEMSGLMIETHCNPSKALTDAKQQITPPQLIELIENLVLRKSTGNIEFQNKLEELRSEIDCIDKDLINILSKRMGVVEEIAKYKKENDITILQIKRWTNIINNRLKEAETKGLNQEFLLKLLQLVHKYSIQLQNEIINKE